MKNLKPPPVTPGILQAVVVLAILYGLAGAILELWNLNIIPGRLEPGLWASLVLLLFWAGFIWLDQRAAGPLKQALSNGGLILIVIFLGLYGALDRSSLTARLAGLAMNWSVMGYGIALFLRVRHPRESRTE